MFTNHWRMRLSRAHQVFRHLLPYLSRRPHKGPQCRLPPRNRRWDPMETYQLPHQQRRRSSLPRPRPENYNHRWELRIHLRVPIQPSRGNQLRSTCHRHPFNKSYRCWRFGLLRPSSGARSHGAISSASVLSSHRPRY